MESILTSIIWESVFGILIGFIFREVVITAVIGTKNSCFEKVNQKIDNKYGKIFCFFIIYFVGSLIMSFIARPINFQQSVSFGLFCSVDFFTKVISKEETVGIEA